MSFKNINWSPVDYSEACIIARNAGLEMLSRLEWMTLKPQVILDVGCGTGEMSKLLKAHYPTARVIALDLSMAMLHDAQKKISTSSFICADAMQIPLQAQTVDLIFANFILPWHENIAIVLREWRRVLKSDGLFMFTALGPDTLQEWRAFLQPHIPQLIDMHDLGDMLLHEGFADPVLDVSHNTLFYREKMRLIHELRATGMWFPDEQMVTFDAISPCASSWDVTYEVIFGHAFAPLSRNEKGVFKIPLNNLRKQLSE